jgi:hypothetical protein
MRFPVVYDVLMRVEIEAKDEQQALQTIAEDIAQLGIGTAVKAAFEVIRDDNAFPPKDVHSRHTNGFAVFTGEQKLDLIAKVAAALDAAARGNKSPGEALLATLNEKLGYLENSELHGVQL